MGWTREQRMILAILPKISSVFSLFGSIWIIIEVATEGRKHQNPYHRLLFAMSVYDTLESFWNFGSTWPIVEGSPDIIWAMGTVGTCEAQGFFLTLSVAVPIYNAMLSVYYILVINYRYTNRQLKNRVEPIMHFIAFFWSFGTACYSVATGLFNNANLWCWIAPLPLDCKDSITYGTVEDGNDKPCIRGDNVWVYRFGFYFIPLWFCIFFATACTLWVYRYVLARDRETLAYRRPDKKAKWWQNHGSQETKTTTSSGDLPAGATAKTNTSTSTKPTTEPDGYQRKRSDLSYDDSQPPTGKRVNADGSVREVFANDDGNNSDIEYEDLKDHDEEEDKKNAAGDINSMDGESIDEEEEMRKIDELVSSNRDKFEAGNEKQSVAFDGEKMHDEIQASFREDLDPSKRSSNQDNIDGSKQGTKSIRDRVKTWKTRRIQYAEDMPRTYEVFKQACYYLGAFYCTHIWSTSNRIVQTISGGGTVFPLIAFHSFFDPFQGFLNYLVYQRPRFIQLRKKHPDMSWWGIMVKALRFSYLDSTRRRSTLFGDSRNSSRNRSGGGRSRSYSGASLDRSTSDN